MSTGFKSSTRARIVPTDPEDRRIYYAEANKKLSKIRYAGIKLKNRTDLCHDVIRKLNSLDENDFATLSKNIMSGLKTLNNALNEDYEFDQPDANLGKGEELCDTDSHEGDSPSEVVPQAEERELPSKPKIKLALKKV
jgi:hypothetical protein